MGALGIKTSEYTDAIADATTLALDDMAPGMGYCFDPSCPRDFPLLRAIASQPIEQIGGMYFDWRANYRDDGDPAFVLGGQTYTPQYKQIEKKFILGLTKTSTNYVVLHDDVQSNRGREKLVDFIAKKIKSVHVGHATLVENTLWGNHPSDTELNPHTAFSWIVPTTAAQVTAGTGSGAFQGLMPYGATTLAGQALTAALTRLQNYNFAWSNTGGVWTDADEANAVKMFAMLGFETPPVPGADMQQPSYAKRQIYVDMTMRQSMVLRAKQQNDQNGSSLSAHQDTVSFLGLTPKWQIQLDDATHYLYRGYHPFVMIDWSAMRPVVRAGDNFRVQHMGASVTIPDADVTYNWLTYNIVGLNRQLLGIGSYPGS